MPVLRPPAIVEDDLGPVGWRALQELAAQRRRRPRDQVLPALQFVLAKWLAGEDVEPSRSDLETLFGKSLESVA